MSFMDTAKESARGAVTSAILQGVANGDPTVAQAVKAWNEGQPIDDPVLAQWLPDIAARYAVNQGDLTADRLVEIYNRSSADADPSVGQKIFEGAVKIGMAYIGAGAVGAAVGAKKVAGDTEAGGGGVEGVAKWIEDLPGTKEDVSKIIQDIPGTKEQAEGLLGAGAAYVGSREQQRTIEAAAEQAKRVAPWYEIGKTALESQAQLLGLTGTPEEQLAALQAAPGYQFRRQMGERQLTSGLAARGGMGSGKAATSAQQWGQGFASQEYANRLAQLSGLSSQGYLAGAGLGSELGTAELLKGEAKMSGLIGAGEALTGGNFVSKTKPQYSKTDYSLASLPKL